MPIFAFFGIIEILSFIIPFFVITIIIISIIVSTSKKRKTSEDGTTIKKHDKYHIICKYCHLKNDKKSHRCSGCNAPLPRK